METTKNTHSSANIRKGNNPESVRVSVRLQPISIASEDTAELTSVIGENTLSMAPIEKYTNATFDNDLLFFTNPSIRLRRRCKTNTHRLRTFSLSFRRSIRIGRLSDFALSVCPVSDRTQSAAHLPFRIRMTVCCSLLKRRCEKRHIRVK